MREKFSTAYVDDLSGSKKDADTTLVNPIGRTCRGIYFTGTGGVDIELFPEAANDLKAAEQLNDQLKEEQRKCLENKQHSPSVRDYEKFGIQKNAKETVGEILKRFTDICIKKHSKKQRFGPGVQYNLIDVGEEFMGVSYGNYGLMFATLVEASKDNEYKQLLIKKGTEVLGNKRGFFQNVPAINTCLECKDGILFVNRGPTAEYSGMFHMVAAGHHNPERPSLIPLNDLVGEQLNKETGLEIKDVDIIRFNGYAFSSGTRIPGTEKAEIITSTWTDLSSEDVAERIKEKAPHRWESKLLFMVKPENAFDVIAGTGDKKYRADSILGLKTYDLRKEDFGTPINIGTDLNSSSYWVPVGLRSFVEHMSIRDSL